LRAGYGVDGLRLKGAVSLPKQYGDGSIFSVGGCQIEIAIAIEITRHQRRRFLARSIVQMRLEGTVTVTQQDADRAWAASQRRHSVHVGYVDTVRVGDG
jgi:hypothetical protein